MDIFWFKFEHLPVIILVMLVAFSVHEFAHAWTAWRFGDDTAYNEGRVTLNPMAHLDWIGMLFLLIGGFGWAKPVPVRRSRFKNPKFMSIAVSAAGPISNLLLAFLMLFVLELLHSINVIDGLSDQMWIFTTYWITINLSLFLFNLIPIPPLDGYRIIEEFLPVRWRIKIMEYSQWTTFIFLLIIFIPQLRNMTIGPLLDQWYPIFENMVRLLDALFGGSMFYAS
ncbi:site-2 protease family protein [Cohnella suwonensis]|uniref:Site-2 protease family protein n=1 Tax=Cohnella suwonensis TaxID=696072 RepID=A0ABW0LPW5_9BACL